MVRREDRVRIIEKLEILDKALGLNLLPLRNHLRYWCGVLEGRSLASSSCCAISGCP